MQLLLVFLPNQWLTRLALGSGAPAAQGQSHTPFSLHRQSKTVREGTEFALGINAEVNKFGALIGRHDRCIACLCIWIGWFQTPSMQGMTVCFAVTLRWQLQSPAICRPLRTCYRLMYCWYQWVVLTYQQYFFRSSPIHTDLSKVQVEFKQTVASRLPLPSRWLSKLSLWYQQSVDTVTSREHWIDPAA